MTPSVRTISVIDLKKHLDQDPNLCLIDIREPQEWSEAHIPGILHIPMQQLAQYCSEQDLPFTHPIYLHCRSGMRSMAAAEQLINLGYQSVYSVEGGIVAWANAGYPIQSMHNSLD